MARKKKIPTLEEVNPTWTISYEIKHNGRNVEAGTELSFKGERGRYRFIKHVVTPTCEWVDVVGGAKNFKQFRAFRPEQIKTVHWKNKTRENATKPSSQ